MLAPWRNMCSELHFLCTPLGGAPASHFTALASMRIIAVRARESFLFPFGVAVTQEDRAFLARLLERTLNVEASGLSGRQVGLIGSTQSSTDECMKER